MEPLEDILISRNELYDLKLGSSEGLVLNGNVRNFSFSGISSSMHSEHDRSVARVQTKRR
ncbi:MAG: hypothetical protein L7V87_05110 [Verrucomicrobiales bacterium]|jgi:hypothetical protein|nr:hypothetical protein [Verrucomicrobiales bacterium]